MLAGNLALTIMFLFLTLLLPLIRWTYRYYRMIKRGFTDNGWLDDTESRKITHGQSSLRKTAVKGLHELSRSKRIVLLSLVIALILTSMWFIWETYPSRYHDWGVYNDDTRVFTEFVNSDTLEVSIKGYHNIFLDSRRCRVGCLVSCGRHNTSRLLMTARWNLTYQLYAGNPGDAYLAVEYWLFSPGGNSIDGIIVYPVIVNEGTVANSTTQQKSAEFNWVCQPDSSYYVGVMLTVILSGFSSVEGKLPGTPATLKVYNITIQEV